MTHSLIQTPKSCLLQINGRTHKLIVLTDMYFYNLTNVLMV